MRGSRMGLIAAMVAASAGSAGVYTHTGRPGHDYDFDLLPDRRRSTRKIGGSRGKRHSDRQRKRPNLNHVSKRVRRKHRRARRAA